VKNYLSWCDVSVDNMKASTAATQTVCVAAGAKIPLSLGPNDVTFTPGTFEIGPAPWHGTDGQGTVTDAGAKSMDTTSITIPAAATTACAWACCPFASGTGCSGIANQCP
jgi:hypothetical protein